MSTSAGIARLPYLVTVGPRVCSCQLPAKDIGRCKTLHKALSIVEGYWNVYLGFFGDQQIWLDFLVTDLRDGVILWRNGRPTAEGKAHGTTQAA
jgi:hypothetical protein